MRVRTGCSLALAAAAACLLFTGAAAAGCVAVPDFVQVEQGSGVPACQQCDAAGAACVKCYEGSGLAKNGTCVKCADDNALDCDGDQSSKALACAWWYGVSAKTGACVECTLVDADGSPTCNKCDGDNPGKCLECSDNYGLTSAGTCAQCPDQPTEWIGSCGTCNGDDPEAGCTKCRPYCNSRGCRGYYLQANATCAECGAGIAACADVTGTPTECRDGLGLVDDACVGCEIDGCKACDGDASTCQECAIPRFFGGTGNWFNGSACVACSDPGCRNCTASADGAGDVCVECIGAQVPDASGRCPTGTDPGCRAYNGTDGACLFCLDGFSLQKGKCVACKTAGCATCPDSPNTCETCLEGQGLVGAKCQACPALPNCTQCDPSNARACLYCADGFELDENGKCGPMPADAPTPAN